MISSNLQESSNANRNQGITKLYPQLYRSNRFTLRSDSEDVYKKMQRKIADCLDAERSSVTSTDISQISHICGGEQVMANIKARGAAKIPS